MSTTTKILDTYMKQLFIDGMRDLGALGAPGDTMYHSNIRENTDFGKLLHKEGLWSLYTYNGLSQSLLYHLCRGTRGWNKATTLRVLRTATAPHAVRWHLMKYVDSGRYTTSTGFRAGATSTTYSHHGEKGTNTATEPKFKLNDTLVEVDGWKLVRPLYPALVGVASYIVHIECRGERRTIQEAGVRSVEPGGVRTGCVICGKAPPDEIIGLEILHNGKI